MGGLAGGAREPAGHEAERQGPHVREGVAGIGQQGERARYQPAGHLDNLELKRQHHHPEHPPLAGAVIGVVGMCHVLRRTARLGVGEKPF